MEFNNRTATWEVVVGASIFTNTISMALTNHYNTLENFVVKCFENYWLTDLKLSHWLLSITTITDNLIYPLNGLNDIVPKDYTLLYSLLYKEINLTKKSLRVLKKCGSREHCKHIFIDFQFQTIINLYMFDLVILSNI